MKALIALLIVAACCVAQTTNEPKITTVPVKGVNELPTEGENKHTYKPTVNAPPAPTVVQVALPQQPPKTVKATITGPAVTTTTTTETVSIITAPKPAPAQIIDLPGPAGSIEAEEVITPAAPLQSGPFVMPEAKPDEPVQANVVQPLTVEQIAAAIHAAMPKPIEYQSVYEYKPEPPKPVFPFTSLTPEQLRTVVLAAAQAMPVESAPQIEYSEPEYKPKPEETPQATINWNEGLTPEQIAAAVKAIAELAPKRSTEFVQPEFKPEQPVTLTGLDSLLAVLKENPVLSTQFQSHPQLMTQLVVQILTQEQAKTVSQPVPNPVANPILVQRRARAHQGRKQH